MARKAFHVVDIAEILMHWHAGRSVREIANRLDVARNTVARYLAPAIAEGITPSDDPLSAAELAEWTQLGFPPCVTPSCGERPGR
ncbi:hypothetical protein [Nonomuraea sp. LPB2021202275-12-8]|uniref:hypothetical protein n=1 Tax=Nonomuraea sp. LPB2021202275-12-8 TaxID=3120159 RepID=UPI00300D2806